MAAGSPLFELFVRVKSEGLKEINREAEAAEKNLQGLNQEWEDFSKQVDKSSKKLEKTFESLGKILEKNKEHVEKYNEAWEKGTKKNLKSVESQDKALQKLGKTLQSINKQVDTLNKKGISLTADTKGMEQAQASLEQLAAARDDLQKNNKIQLEISEKGGKDVLATLQQIAQVRDDLNNRGITLQADSSQVTAMRSEVDDTSYSVDQLSGSLSRTQSNIDSFGSGLDTAGQNMSALREGADGGSESMSRFGVTLGDSDGRARSLAKGLGGRDRDSVSGSIKQMDADAKAASALPSLLGDVFAQLSRFKTIAAGIAAATIPTLIAGVAGAVGAIAALGAGAGALATSLGVGLVGAATSTVAALGLAGGAILATSQAAGAAITNITGLGKSFFAFSTQLKSVEKQAKAFKELLDQLPAGSDAAAAAQERLIDIQSKHQKILELQTEWWNKYGQAAVTAGESLDAIQLSMIEIVNTAGGELIPVLQDFLDVGEELTPVIGEAFDTLVEGVDLGTAKLRNFLKSPEGLSTLESVILAIGEAAKPTFTIISSGLIVALQVAGPFLEKAQAILKTISDLAYQTAAWSRSAEGIAQISAAFEKVFEWSDKALESIGNLVIAIGQLGQGFIYSGLADFMIQGFVDMTQAIRDATDGAGDADSAFRTWLEATKPILTAANEALGAIVKQLLRVADEVVHATDPSTGLPILVEILNGIRDAALPLGNLLVGTFEDLGPVIAELIPKIAHFLELFLGSTPELGFFLDTVNDLLGAFQALPDPVEKIVARLVAYATILSIINPFGVDFLNNLTGIAYFGTGAALNIGKIVTALGGAGGLISMLGTAAKAAGEFMLAIAPLLLIGTIIIAVAITFDYASANEAYDAAIDSGESTGKAWADYFVTGLKGVPILGSLVQLLDDFIPTSEEMGMESGESLVGAYERALTDNQGISSLWMSEEGAQAGEEARASGESTGNGFVEALAVELEPLKEFYETYVQPFIDSVKQGWDDLVQWTSDQWQSIQDTIDEKVQYVYALYEEYVAPYVEEIKAAWLDLEAATSEMWAAFQELIDAVVQYVYSLYETYIKPYVDNIVAGWTYLNDETNRIYQEIYDWIAEKIQAIYDFYETYIAPFVDKIVSKFTDMNNQSKSIWETMQEGILSIIGAIADGVISTVSDMVVKVLGKFADMARGAAAKMSEMAVSLATGSIIPDMADAIIATFTNMTDETLGSATELRDNLITIFQGIKDGTVEENDALIQMIMNSWNDLPDDVRLANEELAHQIKDTLGVSLFEDLTLITNEGMADYQGVWNDIPDDIRFQLEPVAKVIQDHLGVPMFEDLTFQTDVGIQDIMDAWNALPDDMRFSLEPVAKLLRDTLGVSMFEDLTLITNQGMDKFQSNVTQGVQDTTTQVADEVKQIPQEVAPAFDAMGNQVVSAFEQMFRGVDPFVAMMIQAIMRMGSAMQAIGQATGAGTGGFQLTGMPTFSGGAGGAQPRRRARGGIDENSEVQAATGGVSTGAAPRVVYGEQARNVQEAYIVENRADNLPYLAEAASWFGMGLVPTDGFMKRGGRRRGRGRRGGRRGGRRRGHGRGRGAAMTGSTMGMTGTATTTTGRRSKTTTSGAPTSGAPTGGAGGGAGSTTTKLVASGPTGTLLGSTFDQVAHLKYKTVTSGGGTGAGGAGGAATATGGGSRRGRKRKGKRGGRKGATSAAGTTGTTTPTTSAAAPSTAGGTSGAGGAAAAAPTSPSTAAFPSPCGSLYPVAVPTESGQQPYTDAALQESGMVAVPAGGEVGADHVNAPAGMTHPGDASNCGVQGSGTPPPLPMASTALGGPGSATSPYDPCLPSHATTGFAKGGLSDPSSGGMASPISWMDVPLGWWQSGLGYSWYGSPSEDWPELIPPAGWDPSSWYTTGMARGGVLRGGTRYFQGGGLNQYQLEAGDSAASGALGSPYSYGHAGDDGGYDCSGLWQYIYSAVVDGAPTPDVRYWGTYAWAGGFPGGEGTPGAVPGAMNVYTDLTGWEGDGTHTSGDIMGNSYEAIFAGVSGSSSAAGNDGIWSLGDPATIGNWGGVTPQYSVDPSGMMGQQVDSWWNCQAPAPVDIGSAPMYGPVESWMSSLPGMTEPFLQGVGQQSIGTLGSGPAGGIGDGSTRSYIIAALQSLGMDTDEGSISSLESLIACESSGQADAVSPDGAMGLTQLMPDTFAQFGNGGDPFDPIANIAASINYQLSRYGGLISFCPYEDGGLIKEPHLGMMGDAGREVALPLDNKRAQTEIQQALGIERTADAINSIGDRIVSELRHQTKAMPEAIAGGVGSRISRDPVFHGHINSANEALARKANLRGGF